MNPQSKQKTLIAVLIIAILGAGSFWFLGRNSSSSNANYISAPLVKKQRAQATDKKDLKKRRQTKSTKATATDRKQREVPDQERKRKKTRRKNKKQVKKKKMSPAA